MYWLSDYQLLASHPIRNIFPEHLIIILYLLFRHCVPRRCNQTSDFLPSLLSPNAPRPSISLASLHWDRRLKIIDPTLASVEGATAPRVSLLLPLPRAHAPGSHEPSQPNPRSFGATIHSVFSLLWTRLAWKGHSPGRKQTNSSTMTCTNRVN